MGKRRKPGVMGVGLEAVVDVRADQPGRTPWARLAAKPYSVPINLTPGEARKLAGWLRRFVEWSEQR